MLPDFPKAKTLIVKRQLKRFGDVHSQVLGGFTEVPQAPMHEGHRFGLVREDGKLDEMKWKKIQVCRKVKLDDLENWTDERICAHYEGMAAEFAYEQKKMALDEIASATESVGNSIAGGITSETILKLYEKIQLDFQPDGEHVELFFSGSPEACTAFKKAREQLEIDPELRARFEAVIQGKRNEWRERESARKLVG